MKSDLRLERIVDRRLSGVDVRERLRTAVYAESSAARKPRAFRMRRGAALALALLLALLGVGTAFAFSGGALFDRLFPHSQPNEPAMKLSRALEQAYEADGCRFELHDYLYDGSTLQADWTATSSRSENLLFTLSGFSSEGVEIAQQGWEESLLLQEHVELQNNAFSGFSIGDISDASLPDEFTVTMTAYFLRPLVPIVSADSLTDRVQQRLLFRYRPHEDLEVISAISGFEREPDGGYSWYPYAPDDGLNSVESCVRAGFYEIVQQFDVSFVVRPDRTNIVHTRIVGDSVFENDFFRIEFEKADFTAAGTEILYSLHSKVDADSPATDWTLFNLSFDVRVDGRSVLERLQVNRDASDHRDGDGHRMYDGQIWGLPLDEIPTEVTLVPYVTGVELPLPLEPITFRLESY
ncbi:MAG: hypothetical protein Q4E13_02820 [Clostridia bacterium]|nr:hypothetical protein [Clostridia bacterium]